MLDGAGCRGNGFKACGSWFSSAAGTLGSRAYAMTAATTAHPCGWVDKPGARGASTVACRRSRLQEKFDEHQPASWATHWNSTCRRWTLHNQMGRDGGGGGRGRGRGRGQKQSKMTPRVVADVKAERKKGSLSSVKKELRSLTRLLAKVRERDMPFGLGRQRRPGCAGGSRRHPRCHCGVHPYRSHRHRPVLAALAASP